MVTRIRRSAPQARRAGSARTPWLSLVVALGAPAGVAAALATVRGELASSASALVLVAVVVGVAVWANRPAGLLAALSSAAWFDFFLTVPYERFSITHRPDIETALALGVVGLIVTELAARNRGHRAEADEEADSVGIVYYLSELLASGVPASQLVAQGGAELAMLLDLRSWRFEETMAIGRTTRIEHDGTIQIGNLEWDVDDLGLPGKEVELLVTGRGTTLGRFVLEPTPGQPVPRRRLVVAAAVADVVGAALDAEQLSA